MANILATGTTAAGSSAFTLAVGEVATVFITQGTTNPLDYGSFAKIQIQDAGSNWIDVTGGAMSSTDAIKSISSPGTYRVYRTVSITACGIDKV